MKPKGSKTIGVKGPVCSYCRHRVEWNPFGKYYECLNKECPMEGLPWKAGK